MGHPVPAPEGVGIDAVDWLPSGASSGLVRVRGRAAGAEAPPLPDLVIDHEGREHRFTSLPDPGPPREPGAWRGAYVVAVALAAAADRLVLEWPGGGRLVLPAVVVPLASAVPEEPEPEGAEVVDRAVLAELRARRAEAAEAAQTRIAKEALRAVEVLELRANQVEDRLAQVIAERDELQARLAAGASGTEGEAALRERLAHLEAQLAARTALPDVRRPAVDEGRAERLRDALASTIVTVGRLRLQLQEAQLSRRTRDVARGAGPVRLAVVEGERLGLAGALAAARAELRAARAAGAQVAGLQAALSEAQRALETSAAELERAAGRIAELEGAVASAVADRDAAMVDAAHARDEADDRVAAAQAAVAERIAELETQRSGLAQRVGEAESALADAETARELAEARALAAEGQRQAAEAQHAVALERALKAARERPEPAAVASPPAPPPVPAEVQRVAAEQAAAAAVAEPAEGRDRVVADLAAAAEALRRGPTIVSAPTEPPARLARGAGGRTYSPLRGALVKLAHDDPAAAARVIAGLLPAQWKLVDRPIEYDLTLRELGTLAVSVTADGATAEPVARARKHAELHIRTDAVTLAEALSGVGPRARRLRGPLRVSGGPRRLRPLAGLTDTSSSLSLEQAVRAGADLEPACVLRCLAYVIPSAWTRGHVFTVAETITGGDADETVYLTALDGAGMAVATLPPSHPADATVTISRVAFRSLLLGEAPPPGERPAVRGDHRAAEQLRAWADRARRGDTA
jgi:hypothetical protein